MGNGTKVALVALLILMVVVIARFVRNSSEDPVTTAANPASKAGAQPPPTKALDPGKTKAIVPNASNPATGGGISREKPSVALQPPRPANGVGTTSPAPSPGTTPTVTPPNQPGPSVVNSGRSSTGLENTGTTPTGTGASAGANTVTPHSVTPAPVAPPRALADTTESPAPPNGATATPKAPAGTAEKVVPPAMVRPPAPLNGPGTGESRPKPLVDSQLKPEGSRNPSGGLVTTQPPAANQPPRPNTIPVPANPATYPISHTIEKGDSLWSLAQKYYKDATLWQTIEKANPGVKLLPGKSLSIPEPPAPKTRVSQEAPSGNHPGVEPAPRIARDPSSTKSTVTPPKSSKPEKDLTPIERIAQSALARNPAGGRSSGEKSRPEKVSLATTEYVVKKGDTLTQLAKRFYNDASKYYLIEDANESLKYESLQIGAKLLVPTRAVK